MSELGKEQADNVAPSREGSSLLVNAVLPGEFGNEMWSNELAELGQHWQLGLGWFIFHRLILSGIGRQPHQNHPFLWDGCYSKQ